MSSQEAPYVLGDMSHMLRTIDEALALPDAEKWREALETKLAAMGSNNVYALAFLPGCFRCWVSYDVWY